MADPDDRPVPEGAHLWRRVPEWHWVKDGAGGKRPSSAAFEDDPSGSPLSSTVASESTLGRTLDPVRHHEKAFAIAEFPSSVAREKNQAIRRDPTPQEPAHVLLVGEKPKSVSKALARASKWAWPPPGRPYPPPDPVLLEAPTAVPAKGGSRSPVRAGFPGPGVSGALVVGLGAAIVVLLIAAAWAMM